MVYNQKKEDAAKQSVPDDANEPPSFRGVDSLTVDPQTNPHLFVQHVTDLYAEWDTRETIDAVHAALAEVHDVSLIEANEYAFDSLRTERPDIVFNIAEGLYGVSREAHMPAILEMLHIPYTGSDPLALAVCLDKSRAKEILSYHHIPTPKFSVITTPTEIESASIGFPAIVKPLHEGSSKGIINSSLVQNRIEFMREVVTILGKYNEPALVEDYLPGREFTVAMLGNGDSVRVLPIVEIKFDSLPGGVNPIYSYEAKWIWDRSDAPLDIFQCPARISPALQHEIESICRKAYAVLRCRDWCRVDVRLDANGKPQILELNPLPGILPNPEDNSCFPKAARAAGLTYNQLLQSVLALAAKRYDLVPSESSLHPIL
ncbi:MAG: ATP-grasp domain-containing protein [Ignavibacteria bacterium]|nr:ATP-grasp domain-containing protein [Ignavibacteria bacterium]